MNQHLTFQKRNRRALFASTHSNYQQESQLSLTMIMIILIFFVCWMPFGLHLLHLANFHYYETLYVNIVMNFVGEENFHEFHVNYMMLSFLVTILNSLIDPFVYILRMREIRVGIKNIFTCKCHSSSDFDLRTSEIVLKNITSS